MCKVVREDNLLMVKYVIMVERIIFFPISSLEVFWIINFWSLIF